MDVTGIAHVNVIGAGLAGAEAAWQIAKRGIKVNLYEMKPVVFSPAHHDKNYAELVCSNSLRSDKLDNAVGLLKEEMRVLDSLIMECADATRVPAGGALAVDRLRFSNMVTQKICHNPYITVMNKEVKEIPDDGCITVVATGPLTTYGLSSHLGEIIGKEYLYFYDAAAPIVTYESIDMENAFRASRYGRGTEDYINCPMNREQYERFYNELINAETSEIKGFEDKNVFEGCMPIESMARRGIDTIRFGPMKPVGLENPLTGERYYAVVQLRQDNSEGTLYNIVGFQTRLKWTEQKRVFRLIPALKKSEFIRYGVMHRNTFINSPGVLDLCYSMRQRPDLYFAGQITGVEGYVESASSGFVAGLNAAMDVMRLERVIFPKSTAIGALSNYISNSSVKKFQPMNVNFGIMEDLKTRSRNKREKRLEISSRALEEIKNIKVVLAKKIC